MTQGRRIRSLAMSALATTTLVAASLFGVATAAHADHVSSEELASEGGSWRQIIENGEITFTSCSVTLESYAQIGYGFFGEVGDPEDQPTGPDEIVAFLTSLSVYVRGGSGTLIFGLELPSDERYDAVAVRLTEGVNEIALDTRLVFATEHLGLEPGATVADLIDALDEGHELFVMALEAGAPVDERDTGLIEVRWISIGSETYWFGTDPDWFLNDPSCGDAAPEPTPEPEPEPEPQPVVVQPTVPVAVETGIAG